MKKIDYHVGKRTALDGNVWWVCYYTGSDGNVYSVGKFRTKKQAVYFKNHYLV